MMTMRFHDVSLLFDFEIGTFWKLGFWIKTKASNRVRLFCHHHHCCCRSWRYDIYGKMHKIFITCLLVFGCWLESTYVCVCASLQVSCKANICLCAFALLSSWIFHTHTHSLAHTYMHKRIHVHKYPRSVWLTNETCQKLIFSHFDAVYKLHWTCYFAYILRKYHMKTWHSSWKHKQTQYDKDENGKSTSMSHNKYIPIWHLHIKDNRAPTCSELWLKM